MRCEEFSPRILSKHVHTLRYLSSPLPLRTFPLRLCGLVLHRLVCLNLNLNLYSFTIH
jgi:hypothetical protein